MRDRRAGQGDQPGLAGPAELALATGLVLLLADEGRFQPLFDEPLADPLDGGDADLQRLGDLLVDPAGSALGLVGLQQDPGVGQLLGGDLTGGNQPGQLLTLIDGQGDAVLLHGGLLRVRISEPQHDHPATQNG